jgi:hypothetical protein
MGMGLPPRNGVESIVVDLHDDWISEILPD